MSSSRTLSEKFAWTDEQRAIELLDWETKASDFDRLFEFVVNLLTTRNKLTREQLFGNMSEPDLRREVRAVAEKFQEEHYSLPMFIYMRLKFLILPLAARNRKPP